MVVKKKNERHWVVTVSYGNNQTSTVGWLTDAEITAMINRGFHKTDSVTIQSSGESQRPRKTRTGSTGFQG